jgi:ATP-binding cassette subfamily B protein
VLDDHSGTYKNIIVERVDAMETTMAHIIPEFNPQRRAVVLGDVNWLGVLSAGAFGAVTALLLALAGLPEAEEKPEKKME